jgi:hypothetical protein
MAFAVCVTYPRRLLQICGEPAQSLIPTCGLDTFFFSRLGLSKSAYYIIDQGSRFSGREDSPKTALRRALVRTRTDEHTPG